jgi:PAS domain S-box-containing protein
MAPNPPPQPPLPNAAALWQAACRAVTGYMLVIDRAGTILFANRAEEGRSAADVVGRSPGDFAAPEVEAVIHESLEQVFSTGTMQARELPGRLLSGEEAHFSARGVPIMVDDDVVAALVYSEDTLALKKSQDALHRERHVLRQMLEIQERERQLVAYEIHDGLAQFLAGAMMHLQALEHAAGPAGPSRELHESLRLLRAAVDESRRLISGLRPPTLDELGIVEAVDSLVADARIDVPQVTFTHDLPPGRLAAQLETTIFRIVQESLSNARRHANASRVDVVIAATGAEPHRRIRASIHDNGVGFDPTAVPDDRFGLEGIRQRARMLGSEAVIRSAPGQGTTIEVDLPLLIAED